jgi:chromosome partitioning protein
MHVITFASSKGGAGKTTSAIILATTLAQEQRVLLIDADPAKRLISWAEKAPLPENLEVIASKGERSIHDEIDRGRKDFDFTIVDLEGAATRLNAFAMGESSLVIIPMGDEQPDAEAAIETLAQLALEARALRREIPVRILFARTQAAIKSRLEKSLNSQVRQKVGSFKTELHRRTAFSSLHSLGGTLRDLPRNEVTGVEKAIVNAEWFAEELKSVIGWIEEIRSDEPVAAIEETQHV